MRGAQWALHLFAICMMIIYDGRECESRYRLTGHRIDLQVVGVADRIRPRIIRYSGVI
jgi:hypothetical protein